MGEEEPESNQPESTGADAGESETNGRNGGSDPDGNGNEEMGDLLDMEESRAPEDTNQVVTHGDWNELLLFLSGANARERFLL